MKTTIVLLLLALAFSCKTNEYAPADTNTSLEPKSSGEIVNHIYYSLAYSEDDEQAYWVFYHLTPELINGTQKRTDDFREDPLVKTGSATLADYKGSGYDRGHLCPAADMKLNETAMSETFFLSNMSPQEASFNRGIWSKLESKVRAWALQYDGLYVATGGILTAFRDRIGINDVTVPEKYYKVLYSPKNGMIAFVLPNEGSQRPLADFAVPVDSIEVLTGIDFFSGLEDEVENELESTTSIFHWIF